MTRRGDEVARQRQALPWVRVDSEYRFETEAGPASLGDLFKGRSQLLVYHFMFGPGYAAGCPSCSALADGFNGFAIHLAHHDVMLVAVSRAPLASLLAFRQRMGWSFPWASAADGTFNFDFNVSITEEQQRLGTAEYNYRKTAPTPAATPTPPSEMAIAFAGMAGADIRDYTRERPGMSAFARSEGAIYHTYSTYGRGLDGLWGMYQWLDRAPLGRNETGPWWRHHDRYDQS